MALIAPDASYSVQACMREIEIRLRALENSNGSPDSVQALINESLDVVRREVNDAVQRPATLDSNDVFKPSGNAHEIGFVPDPGATAGALKFLREDATWVSLPTDLPSIGCSLRNTANQTYSQGTVYAVLFDSQDFDTHGFHNNSTNKSRITIPSGLAGYYLFGGSIWVGTSGVMGGHNIRFGINGNLSDQPGLNGVDVSTLTSYLGASPILLHLNDSDYVEIFDSVGGSGTATISALSSYHSPNFWCARVGK